jgi:hypothetical protein
LTTKLGIATYRSSNAVYQTGRVRNLTKPGEKRLEPDAGLCRTTYYGRTLGTSNYTIVGLPMTNVAQVLFLWQALDPDAIWIPGDPAETQAGLVRIFPPRWFRETGKQFDMVLNSDSMAVYRGRAVAYAEKISRKPCVSFSINHENNAFTVDELIESESSVGWFPCRLRKGYAEEPCVFGRKDRPTLEKRTTLPSTS